MNNVDVSFYILHNKNIPICHFIYTHFQVEFPEDLLYLD